jgi:lipopolysaccharide export system ATP-binding protein
VNDVSIHIDQAEIVGLLGPNGAGKTTTFYMITGLVRPSGGKVLLDDRLISKWPMYKRARAGIGYLPQEASVFRKMSVEDNMRLVLQLAGKSRKEIRERIARVSEEMHITHILDRKAQVLSGGERRRTEIARALCTDPKFILLDEPFTGIDPVTIEEIQDILFRLKARGIGILITDHNVSATLRITDRNYILIDGKIIAQGSGEQIADDPLVRRHYLGQQFSTDSIFANGTTQIMDAVSEASPPPELIEAASPGKEAHLHEVEPELAETSVKPSAESPSEED